MLSPERAPKQHWFYTRLGWLELTGYVAVFVAVFMLIYGLLL